MLIASHTNSPRLGTRTAKIAVVALLAGVLAACGSVDRTGRAFWQPYRPNVQQGNWITQQQVALLRPGMTREQVRFALGTPTLTPVFHAERWDYPYFMKPGYGKTQERRFTVFFENDLLVRWEGDEQPRVQPFQDPKAVPEQEALQADLPQQQPMIPGNAVSEQPGEPATAQTPDANTQPPVNVNKSVLQLQNRSPSSTAQDQINPTTGSVPLR